MDNDSAFLRQKAHSFDFVLLRFKADCSPINSSVSLCVCACELNVNNDLSFAFLQHSDLTAYRLTADFIFSLTSQC